MTDAPVNLARSERLALCDLLLEKGPDAKTLCEGWTTRHLAAHLWVRESDPVAAPGIMIKPLAGVTEKRMDQAMKRLEYPELVARVERGPGRLSFMSIPGLDEAANGIEFYVHHEDVRRAGEGWEPREFDAATQEVFAKRLGLMGRAMFRRSEVPLVAQRTDVPTSDTIVLKPGDPHVLVKGIPSELLLLAFGRGRAARLEFEGDEADIEKLLGTPLGI